ncbi:MAG: SH3 domain-containing protein [Candidatus Riflebacteria bacterium]|nr:SH3 domain-containing protein [Candidatus Riflebacteria bacterium]
MHRKFTVIFLVLTLLMLTNSLMAQNDPFDEQTSVNNPQSSSGLFAVDAAASAATFEINGSWVNVRSGPGTGNSVLKTLPRGSEGTKLEEKNSWFKIDFGNGLIGWVRGDLVTQTSAAAPSQPAPVNSSIATYNTTQFERWNRHLGDDLLNYDKFPWYWRLNRANKAFEKGNYKDAYELACKASGNPIEAAYMQAMCLDKMGQQEKANQLLKSLEKPFEDLVFSRKMQALADPYINEPIVFKFGGFDDIDAYRQKKSAGNRIGLNSAEYYEKYVDINTWKWRSNSAYKEFEKIGGIDCSGFVQMIQKDAYQQAGVKYPISTGRTSTSGLWSEKYTKSINPGVKPPPPPDIRPGDMILLDYGHNRYGHSMIYKGKDSQGNILVMQMGDTAEVHILPAEKFQFYKGTYRMNGMDQVRKAMTA